MTDAISLCFQPHLNTLSELKQHFQNFKRCWDRIKPVLLSISDENITLMTINTNEMMPDIEQLFKLDNPRFIENIIIKPPPQQDCITLQILDFEGFATMFAGIDNNLSDLRIYLDEQEKICLGVEEIKLDDTTIQRRFEVKILQKRDYNLFPKSELDFMLSSSDLSMYILKIIVFNLAHKFKSSVFIYFYSISQLLGLKMCVVGSEESTIITQFILPPGIEKESLPPNAIVRYQIHYCFCQKVFEICNLHDIVQIGVHDDFFVISYNSEGVSKQFKIPQLEQSEIMQSKIEK